MSACCGMLYTGPAGAWWSLGTGAGRRGRGGGATGATSRPSPSPWGGGAPSGPSWPSGTTPPPTYCALCSNTQKRKERRRDERCAHEGQFLGRRPNVPWAWTGCTAALRIRVDTRGWLTVLVGSTEQWSEARKMMVLESWLEAAMCHSSDRAQLFQLQVPSPTCQ